jgi:hypothetical protein
MSLEIQVLACDRNKTVTRTTVVNGIQVLACDRDKAVARATVVNGIQFLAWDWHKNNRYFWLFTLFKTIK